jgi:hypothetical protein
VTHEESKGLENQVSQLKDQFKDMDNTMLKKVAFTYLKETLKKDLEQKME